MTRGSRPSKRTSGGTSMRSAASWKRCGETALFRGVAFQPLSAEQERRGRWGKSQRAGELRASGSSCTTPVWPSRSEEHTSELQSQSNLVCRLLLEKKKKNKDV